MTFVTKEHLAEVWRAYLKKRIDEQGGVRKFAAKLGLSNHNRVTKVMTGNGFISPELLVAISEHIGPSVAAIYTEIAKACVDAEVNAVRYERVATGRSSAPVPAEARADVERALRESADDARLRPQGRPAQVGEREDVPPQSLHEAAARRS